MLHTENGKNNWVISPISLDVQIKFRFYQKTNLKCTTTWGFLFYQSNPFI